VAICDKNCRSLEAEECLYEFEIYKIPQCCNPSFKPTVFQNFSEMRTITLRIRQGQWRDNSGHILICDLILLYNFSKAFSFINLALKDEMFLLTDEE
jgi:hypothetical protein